MMDTVPGLTEEQEDLVRRVLEGNPELTREEAIEYLREAGM
jgi:hypothetical protein